VPLSCYLGTLTSWNPLGHSRPVTGLLHLYLYHLKIVLKQKCYKFLKNQFKKKIQKIKSYNSKIQNELNFGLSAVLHTDVTEIQKQTNKQKQKQQKQTTNSRSSKVLNSMSKHVDNSRPRAKSTQRINRITDYVRLYLVLKNTTK
jgi:hypothetical protein